MPESLFIPVCFSERKLDPAGCQCHHWTPVLHCHPIPSLFLSGMHFSHSFVLSSSLFSGPRCPRQLWGGGVLFDCPTSIHPCWWNWIRWPPLCPVVFIPSPCLISVRNQKLVCEGGGGDLLGDKPKTLVNYLFAVAILGNTTFFRFEQQSPIYVYAHGKHAKSSLPREDLAWFDPATHSYLVLFIWFWRNSWLYKIYSFSNVSSKTSNILILLAIDFTNGSEISRLPDIRIEADSMQTSALRVRAKVHFYGCVLCVTQETAFTSNCFVSDTSW